jgi:hypothetical protein
VVDAAEQPLDARQAEAELGCQFLASGLRLIQLDQLLDLDVAQPVANRTTMQSGGDLTRWRLIVRGLLEALQQFC